MKRSRTAKLAAFPAASATDSGSGPAPRGTRAPKAAAPSWFVYLARCSDGSLYTGIARDVRARIAQHDAGKGARYTRGRGPLTLCAVRRCTSKGDALRLELGIKRLTRAEKEQLIGPRRLATFARRWLAARVDARSKSSESPERGR